MSTTRDEFEEPRAMKIDPEVHADLDRDDLALFEVMGVIEDAPRRDDVFIARTLERVRRSDESSRLRRWAPWVAGIAALIIAGYVLTALPGDAETERGGEDRIAATGAGMTAAAGENLDDVIALLRGMSDEELLALEAGEVEADEAEYFGG